MNENRLPDYLDHIQQAVIMSLIVIGEAATIPVLLKQLAVLRPDADDEGLNEERMDP